ncbi:MAG: amidohydrolase family protein [Terracidiphilus sp.]|jgi:L-fuconolactonase
MRIDAHHHLWHYTPEEFDWIDDRMQVLRRDFLADDLHCELESAGIEATVVVQARQTLQETHWLLETAAANSFIHGVVGWAPIAEDDFSATLDQLRHNSLLKGLRHVVQGEASGFLDGHDFNRGINALTETGLVYDILVYVHQLEEVIRFVDRHPRQSFVLDHIAKPEISSNNFAPWDCALRELARRENLVCKLSGMVTEANWAEWTPQCLRPYFDTVLEAFEPSRLMFGSDWPVLTVASTYSRWQKTVYEWTAPLTQAERAEIEGNVAARIYRLGSAQQES